MVKLYIGIVEFVLEPPTLLRFLSCSVVNGGPWRRAKILSYQPLCGTVIAEKPAISADIYRCCESQNRHVVEVKVGLHCDDCIKKILKAIKKIQDIETYNVDTKLNKVIVTGNVTTEQVTRVLHKIGKNATPFQEDAI
ncbi:protein SODIUM POTASSIUM ROOT DEFECTIVE 2 [Lathyrus oleraceus]|uniref:protein SODIUM POTASSIUM ROOT DEFECTIVE 2 n=1 Tax=Pisum sativum TaxID=3888 RepID=UPI0021CE49F1|nr:protein SODIUM POTASSIUM ROOT DEFECTIVE 2-like [Pisum sativum]